MYPFVSVIMPTWCRPERLPAAYRVFTLSNYPSKELLVYDDSPDPSEFMLTLGDPQVVYYHDPRRVSIGAKRNFLIERAQGEVIAHQDDDDSYASDYLETMVSRLTNFDLVKLSAFYVHDERSRTTWIQNTSAGLLSFFSQSVWGYGFSYVYRKDLYTRGIRFPDISLKEDYAFVQAAKAAGARLRLVSDHPELVVHTVHPTSTSICPRLP